jgi:hypothetical protein
MGPTLTGQREAVEQHDGETGTRNEAAGTGTGARVAGGGGGQQPAGALLTAGRQQWPVVEQPMALATTANTARQEIRFNIAVSP